jgi:hypothetical protein
VIDDESLVKTQTNTCLSYTSAVPSAVPSFGQCFTSKPIDDNAFIALDLKKYSRTLAIIREIKTKILSDRFAKNQTL